MRLHSMNEAAPRTIRNNKDSIRKRVAAGSLTSGSTALYMTDVAMENMGKA